MFASIQAFFGLGGGLANSAINSNGVINSETESKNAAYRNDNSSLIAEWVVNSDHIVSAIYLATERQAAFPRDIVILVTEYLRNHEALKSLSMFGPSDWKATFNKKVEMIKPPPEMDAFLQRINPFTGKLNAESCLCVFIPSHYQDIPTITNTKEEQEVTNNPLVPLTPATMEELAKNPVNLHNQSKFNYFLNHIDDENARKKLKKLHVKKSYWVVITQDVIPDSRNQSYSKQQELINEKGAKEYWQVPSIREAIICAFSHYAKTGVRILNDNPFTYTRCVEQIDGSQTIVGGFEATGLDVHDFDYAPDFFGVVVLRKFAF